MTEPKKFVMIEPFTGKLQEKAEVKFGASRIQSKTKHAIAKLVEKSMQEDQQHDLRLVRP